MGSVSQGESSRRGSGAIKRTFSRRTTRVDGTRGLGAAGVNPGRRSVHGCVVGKMPDAGRFSTAVGSEGARELVAVARCAVSQSLGRLPVPMINVRGLGSSVEAGRRWALDERGTRISWGIYICSPDNAGGGRARGVVPPSGRQLPSWKVPGWRAFGLLLFNGPRRMLGALFVETGEGVTDWCTVMAELMVFLP